VSCSFIIDRFIFLYSTLLLLYNQSLLLPYNRPSYSLIVKVSCSFIIDRFIFLYSTLLFFYNRPFCSFIVIIDPPAPLSSKPSLLPLYYRHSCSFIIKPLIIKPSIVKPSIVKPSILKPSNIKLFIIDPFGPL